MFGQVSPQFYLNEFVKGGKRFETFDPVSEVSLSTYFDQILTTCKVMVRCLTAMGARGTSHPVLPIILSMMSSQLTTTGHHRYHRHVSSLTRRGSTRGLLPEPRGARHQSIRVLWYMEDRYTGSNTVDHHTVRGSKV